MTIERLVVNKAEYSFEPAYFEHIARYRFARESIEKSAKVLDAACGTGYGSHLLARKFRKVHGIDISKEAIDHCKRNFRRDGLLYHVMNTEDLSFDDGEFDAVVSFETIEHLERPAKYLDELSRVLKSAGTLIVSTPVKGVYEQTFLGDNPYHLHEMSIAEFQAELSVRFSIQGLFGQTYLSHMRASEEKLERNAVYKGSVVFLVKSLLRKHMFSNPLMYPAFLALSRKCRENKVVPYIEGGAYKLITAMCTKR